MSISLVVIGILLLICFSAFSSASEMAYSSCNLLRLENLRDEGSKRAAVAVKIASRFDDARSTILIGNNLQARKDYIVEHGNEYIDQLDVS